MSLWLFASALVLVYPAVGFGQTAKWEERRRPVLQMRDEGHLHEAFEGARKLLAEAEHNEPDAPPLPMALHDYGVIACDLTMYAEAERALKRAIAILETAPPADAGVLQLFRLRLAEVYLDAGQHKEARAIFVALRETLEQSKPEPAVLGTVLGHLAWLDVLQRKFGDAESLLQRSIQIMEANPDTAPFRRGEALNDYAGLLLTMRRFADAASYAERAQAVLDRPGAAPNQTLINTWTLLGAAYGFTGRAREAEAHINRAISAAQSLYGEDSRRLGRLMTVAAAVLRQCGQKVEAKSLNKKASQILANAGRDDPGRFTVDIKALR